MFSGLDFLIFTNFNYNFVKIVVQKVAWCEKWFYICNDFRNEIAETI